jgi:hypothetical protein
MIVIEVIRIWPLCSIHLAVGTGVPPFLHIGGGRDAMAANRSPIWDLLESNTIKGSGRTYIWERLDEW